MSQAASRSACRYALVLLAFLAILSQLWKLGSFFASNKEATHEVYFDVDGSYAVLIKTNTMSNGRIFIRNSPPIMYAGDGLATSTLQQHRRHSPAAQRSSKSNTDTLLFAHGGAMKPYQSIIKAQWVSKLQDLLKTINKDQPSLQQSQQNQITVVVSNTNYTLSLLNWLVSALVKTTPPLENVIVICLDKTLYTLLGRKKIPSLYVNPETVISGPMHTKSSHIWITRCAVYRLLNHWGYDIVAYDTDAIVLKNLQHILDAHHESDIVASSGTYPFQLGVKWGLTLCMGVILIRSTRSTELMWNSLSQIRNDTYDDQVKLNYALNGCSIEWFSQGRNIENQAISGQCAKRKLKGLKVTVLPRSLICRKCRPQHKNSYYVWHSRSKRAGDMKMKMAVSGYTWFLKKSTVLQDGGLREEKEIEELKGVEWLKAISD